MSKYKERANELLAEEFVRQCCTCVYWEKKKDNRGLCKAMMKGLNGTVVIEGEGESVAVTTCYTFSCGYHSFI